ncbi:MAG: hypothetical protein IPJ41_01780 [Phycisphaerales bacterium]|nr:hypothetical protein [Phycisphaerales bacterium]
MTSESALWRIRGARRDSGADIEIVVPAADRDHAASQAAHLGILVSSIDPQPTPPHHAAADAPPPANAEKLVRVYSSRPRDHLYIGWFLRHRRHLVVTTHRVVLHERLLFSSRTASIDTRAVEGALVGRVFQWRIVIGTIVIGTSGAQALPFLYLYSSAIVLPAACMLGLVVLIGLVLSRADFVGVTSASMRVGLVRYGVPRGTGERFLHDVQSVLREGADRDLMAQVLGESLRENQRVCPSCRYPLVGLIGVTSCPECGAALPPSAPR